MELLVSSETIEKRLKEYNPVLPEVTGGYQTTDSVIGEVGYFNIGVGGNGLDFGELDQTVYTPGTKSGG